MLRYVNIKFKKNDWYVAQVVVNQDVKDFEIIESLSEIDESILNDSPFVQNCSNQIYDNIVSIWTPEESEIDMYAERHLLILKRNGHIDCTIISNTDEDEFYVQHSGKKSPLFVDTKQFNCSENKSFLNPDC